MAKKQETQVEDTQKSDLMKAALIEAVATPEEIRKAAKKESRRLKGEAFLHIKELCDAQEDKTFTEGLKLIRPSLYGFSQVSGTGSAFIDLVDNSENQELHENELFNTLKIGRREAFNIIKKQLKRAEPAKRVWISFNNESGIYKLEGSGETPPANWKGFIPMDPQSIELL